MSAATRKELLKHIKERYREAHYRDKSKILDEFCTLVNGGIKARIYGAALCLNCRHH